MSETGWAAKELERVKEDIMKPVVSYIPGYTILRHETRDTKGCERCGATARWVDSAQGPDGWTLPCGHRGKLIDITVVTTTVTKT